MHLQLEHSCRHSYWLANNYASAGPVALNGEQFI